jgi:hypothetical protein
MNFTRRVADYFEAHPDEWIDGRVLEGIGGRYAWRTRISNCRTQLGLDIENRLRRVRTESGQTFVISEYRFVGAAFRLRA